MFKERFVTIGPEYISWVVGDDKFAAWNDAGSLKDAAAVVFDGPGISCWAEGFECMVTEDEDAVWLVGLEILRKLLKTFVERGVILCLEKAEVIPRWADLADVTEEDLVHCDVVLRDESGEELPGHPDERGARVCFISTGSFTNNC
jgi:hypothetical protein